MLGAIIGDIVGSRFEWNNHKSKDFNLFSEECFFTDDSVMTLAIAKALLDCIGDYRNLSEKAISAMQELGRPYPNCGYGGMFQRWMYSDDPKPYNSYGNGAAMRVSACGFIAKTLEEAKELSRKVTEVTHNHPEGIKGAEATTVAIFLARKGYKIDEIREYINEHYYKMDFTLDEIRDTYEFNETCQETVPQAIMAFLESSSFEDAIKNAISIGGDSDTIAAITGGIAEAYYGVPLLFENLAKNHLDERLLTILTDFQNRKNTVEIPIELCGSMHHVKRRSTFDIAHNILKVYLEQDAGDSFIQGICNMPSLPLAIISINNISIDNEHCEKAVSCAVSLASVLKRKGTCVICICQDHTEIDKKGNKKEAPIEIKLRELKENSNTLIIAQRSHESKNIINMLLSFFADASNQTELLIDKFSNGGYAYYNDYYRPDALNSEAHMDYIVVDSLFICPIYLSKEVFCCIEGGREFVLDAGDSMGDEGIMTSYLSDYLQTDKVYCNVWKNPNLLPCAINTQLLFCGFCEKDFAFNEKWVSQYVDSADEKLNKRIKRMLTIPFHNKTKAKRYDQWLDQNCT